MAAPLPLLGAATASALRSEVGLAHAREVPSLVAEAAAALASSDDAAAGAPPRPATCALLARVAQTGATAEAVAAALVEDAAFAQEEAAELAEALVGRAGEVRASLAARYAAAGGAATIPQLKGVAWRMRQCVDGSRGGARAVPAPGETRAPPPPPPVFDLAWHLAASPAEAASRPDGGAPADTVVRLSLTVEQLATLAAQLRQAASAAKA